MKKTFLITLFIAIYLVFLFSFLEISAYNIALGILSIITLFTVSLIFGKVFIKSSIPSLRKFSPFFYSLSIIVGIVFVSGFTIMAAQNFISLKRAEKLVNNINQYKQESGHFPATLEDLTPTYYTKIPKTPVGFSGNDFIYFSDSDYKNKQPIVKIDSSVADYKLAYKSVFGIEYKYLSQFQSWESSDEYEIDKIKHIDIREPITGFFVTSGFSKDHNKK
ncbi:MAG: hypothetical protein R6U11_10075 [Bacteroidales bacterium]